MHANSKIHQNISKTKHAHDKTAKFAKLNIRTANRHMERPTNCKLR